MTLPFVTDNNAMTCVTKKQPDGTYLLNGQKTWVTLGGLSIWTMVVAKDEDPSYENDKYSLWLVPNDAGAYASERICFKKPIAHQTAIQLHLCEMGGGTTEVMDYIAGRQLVKKYKAK